MNLGAEGLARMMRRDLRGIVRRKELNTQTISGAWRADPEGFDPNLESTWSEGDPQSGQWEALVHYVDPTKSTVRNFSEIQSGDVIVELIDDTELPAAVVTFDIGGVKFAQKDVGAELAEYYDLVIGGQRIFRTLVLARCR